MARIVSRYSSNFHVSNMNKGKVEIIIKIKSWFEYGHHNSISFLISFLVSRDFGGCVVRVYNGSRKLKKKGVYNFNKKKVYNFFPEKLYEKICCFCHKNYMLSNNTFVKYSRM